jgi:hypothetical protein
MFKSEYGLSEVAFEGIFELVESWKEQFRTIKQRKKLRQIRIPPNQRIRIVRRDKDAMGLGECHIAREARCRRRHVSVSHFGTSTLGAPMARMD